MPSLCNDNIIPYKNLALISNKIDMLIVIGGDGTFLESIQYLAKNNIPIVGINSGRLGFLANIKISETEKAIKKILQGKYTIEPRTMLELSEPEIFESNNIALNDFTVHKLDISSMISIDLYINNLHVNTYWADGLIVSTPTGSTAYSLSAGGPIIHPQANTLIITPIAAHNLNVRPLIIPDKMKITLKVSGRTDKCLISLDSRFKAVPINTTFKLKKSKHLAKILNIYPNNYFNTLKNKLLWGADKRN
jgi:NAD+ kinase